MPVNINVKDDFSETPGTRKVKDGPYSGEAFYKELLEKKYIEACTQDCKLKIDLDGTYGYAISFLDEAFGELSKIYGFNESINRLCFISEEDPDLPKEITKVMQESA